MILTKVNREWNTGMYVFMYVQQPQVCQWSWKLLVGVYLCAATTNVAMFSDKINCKWNTGMYVCMCSNYKCGNDLRQNQS